MNHEIVLAKLHFFGPQGLCKNWLKSFVTIRKQKIEVKSPDIIYHFFSNWGTLKQSSPRSSSRASVVHLLILLLLNRLTPVLPEVKAKGL